MASINGVGGGARDDKKLQRIEETELKIHWRAEYGHAHERAQTQSPKHTRNTVVFGVVFGCGDNSIKG
ncbi:unnamed protein product [Linum trigynum]|uniref:Uncharacterized protein n=1 Tax=Linum trigynum TaxID=586398 RepID=A0AAV2FGH7_9ROSI